MNVCQRQSQLLFRQELTVKRRRLVVAAMAVSALTLPATPAEGATTVECGSTVTVNTRLASDLTCSSGLTLANGATLNLGGHTLAGPGASSEETGIVLQGSLPTTVRNGTVKGWGHGIANAEDGNEEDAPRLVKRVTLTDNGAGLGDFGLVPANWEVTRSRFVNNVAGISAVGGSVTVSGSAFIGNTRDGIDSEVSTVKLSGGTFSGSPIGVHAYGGGVMSIIGTRFSGNDVGVHCSERIPSMANVTFKNNTRYGFYGFDCAGPVASSTFTGNEVGWFDQQFDEVEATSAGAPPWAPSMKISDSKFTSNGTGVFAREGITVDNTVFTSNVTGLTASSLQKPLVQNSWFRRNTDGIYLTNGGSIGQVTAKRNKNYGIYAPGAVDLGGNVAHGNGANPECIGVVCASK